MLLKKSFSKTPLANQSFNNMLAYCQLSEFPIVNVYNRLQSGTLCIQFLMFKFCKLHTSPQTKKGVFTVF